MEMDGGKRSSESESGSGGEAGDDGGVWSGEVLGWTAERREELEKEAVRELRECRDARVASTTTYIERADDLSLVIRGMFGGPGRAEDKRQAKAKAREVHVRSEAEAAAEKEKGLQLRLSPRGLLAGIRFLGTVLWVGCCPPLPEPILQKILFQPPEKPLYAFRERKGDKLITRGSLSAYAGRALEVVWPVENRTEKHRIEIGHVEGLAIPRGHGRRGSLAALFFPCPGARLLFLHSHGNAQDLGLCIQFAAKLRRKLNCAVLSYDYSGYGLSDGEACEESLYADVLAVAAFAQRLDWPAEQTVAFGFSLGTAATAFLASRSPKLAAIVLAGAFISALNCLRAEPDPDHLLRRMDKLRTYKTVATIRQPTLLIHGLDDRITPFQHALWILERTSQPLQPLFLPDTGHNDLDKAMLWSRLRQLVEWELNLGHPYPSLRALFARLLRQQVRGIHSTCVRAHQLCRDCHLALVEYYFDEQRCEIVELTPAFARDSRCLHWDVEPAAGDEGGAWLARFKLTVTTPLLSTAEVRALASRSHVPLPPPPPSALSSDPASSTVDEVSES